MAATNHYRIVPTVYGGEPAFVLERLHTGLFGPKWRYVTSRLNKEVLQRLVEHLKTQPEYV